MRIILDTGIFFQPHVLKLATRLPHEIIVPAVVFTERARQVARDGGDPEELQRTLERNDHVVEPYGVEEARRRALEIHDDATWRRLARDAMIAGHLREDDVVWTTNPRDFVELGVPEERVHAW